MNLMRGKYVIIKKFKINCTKLTIKSKFLTDDASLNLFGSKWQFSANHMNHSCNFVKSKSSNKNWRTITLKSLNLSALASKILYLISLLLLMSCLDNRIPRCHKNKIIKQKLRSIYLEIFQPCALACKILDLISLLLLISWIIQFQYVNNPGVTW